MFFQLLLIFLIIAVMVHHKVKHGYWFDVHDLDNHETIAVFLLGLLVGSLL